MRTDSKKSDSPKTPREVPVGTCIAFRVGEAQDITFSFDPLVNLSQDNSIPINATKGEAGPGLKTTSYVELNLLKGT